MKIGRNDACPCGSGRKYKHCCLGSDEAARAPFCGEAGANALGALSEEQAKQMMLAQTGFSTTGELDAAMKEYREHCETLPDHTTPPTFMEFLGRPNLATQQQKGLSAATAGKEFGSPAEVKQFARGYIEDENMSPVADFEGLSSGQMHRILTQEFGENTDMVELADDLPDREALSAELVDAVQWLLVYFADKGGEVGLTKSESYNRNLCRAYCEGFPRWFGRDRSVPQETSLLVLQTAHDAIRYLGYTDGNRTKEWLSTDGVDLFCRRDWAQLYRALFTYAVDVHDWKLWIPEEMRAPHFDLVQDAALFLLYLLHKYPQGTVGGFIDRVTRAFPDLIRPAQDDPAILTFIAGVVSELFFARFCIVFGLVTSTDDPSDFPAARGVEYEVTPLFARAFRWKV